MKPYLTDKTLKTRETLIENEKVVSDENLWWKLFKYCVKLRYSTASKYYPSPWPGVKCNKKNWKPPKHIRDKKLKIKSSV